MENLVQYETAILAKEKGYIVAYPINLFDENKEIVDTKRSFDLSRQIFILNEKTTIAPTQDELKNWLLENFFLYILPIPTVTCCWTFKIIDVQCDPQNEIERPPYSGVDAYGYSTYREAYEAGLKEALNKIKITSASTKPISNEVENGNKSKPLLEDVCANLVGRKRLEEIFNFFNKQIYRSEKQIFFETKVVNEYSILEIFGCEKEGAPKECFLVYSNPYFGTVDGIKEIIDKQCDQLLYNIIIRGCESVITKPFLPTK